MARRAVLSLAVTALLALAALPISSGAAPSGGPLWATVNECGASPDTVGVRASMPADDNDTSMWAQFTAQWYSEEQSAWLPIEGVPTSPWLFAGSSKLEAGQVGYTFEFAPPAPGTSVQVRGIANLEWRRNGAVLRREQRITSAASGVDVGSGANAVCVLR
jgi:hypothetical protein